MSLHLLVAPAYAHRRPRPPARMPKPSVGLLLYCSSITTVHWNACASWQRPFALRLCLCLCHEAVQDRVLYAVLRTLYAVQRYTAPSRHIAAPAASASTIDKPSQWIMDQIVHGLANNTLELWRLSCMGPVDDAQYHRFFVSPTARAIVSYSLSSSTPSTALF